MAEARALEAERYPTAAGAECVAAGMSPIAWTRRQVTVVRLGACGLELGAVCESLEAREPRGEE